MLYVDGVRRPAEFEVLDNHLAGKIIVYKKIVAISP
jgi:hypothetical protein